jgi:hypothetical protein
VIVRIVLLAVLLATARAQAAPRELWSQENEETQADAGDFLPYSQSPAVSSSFASVLSGYDTARGGAVVTSTLQARLHEHVYLILSGTYTGPGDTTLEPSVVGEAILLDETPDGVGLAVQAGWERNGFNDVPAVIGRVAVGKHFGDTYVIGGAEMGFGTVDNERYLELTLGGLRELLPDLCAGFDTRGHVDLQHDTDPAGETSWDVQAGPVVTYGAGPVAFTATAGVSALRLHHAPTAEAGAITLLGAGTVF